MKKVTRKEFDALAEKVAHLESMKAEESPKIINKRAPKLDQSVFDGQDEKWQWAAVDRNGKAHRFTHYVEPHPIGQFVADGSPDFFAFELIGAYDASDWQNSLIQRASKELKGSDLAKAMLARGDACVPCDAYDGIEEWKRGGARALVVGFENGAFHDSADYDWEQATPINPRTGEPLTAAEAGF